MKETPEQYRQRMLDFQAGRDPFTILAATPKRLEHLVEGVPPARLRKRPAPGKWSIAEIVCHLADSELARSVRIRMILGAPGTHLQTFDQDAWVVALHYDRRNIQSALREFRTLREANLALFHSLNPEQWKLSGIHPDHGEQILGSLPPLAAGHDINHLQQVARILAAPRK